MPAMYLSCVSIDFPSNLHLAYMRRSGAMALRGRNVAALPIETKSVCAQPLCQDRCDQWALHVSPPEDAVAHSTDKVVPDVA